MDFSKFHVITVISNPIRYKSRYDLYQTFNEDIRKKGAQLWTIELATGSRFHRVTEKDHPNHIQVWGTALSGVIWNKETLQNIAVQHMTSRYPDWRKVCFVDADVKFEQGWLEETSHALELYPVVQPWSHAVDFAPGGGLVGTTTALSYAFCHVEGIPTKGSGYAQGGHPGYAMAMRRETYNHLGGLIDVGILGSGDRHMLSALVGKVHQSYHHDVSRGYKRWLHEWQKRADIYVKRNLGYVPMLVRHLFHGSKKDRQYGSRWKILTKGKFDPYTDLKRDTNGAWQLIVENDRQIWLRDQTYGYMRSRKEDANSL